MGINKIIKLLKHPPIPIPSSDHEIIKDLKNKFEHSKRSFVFNRIKYYVDCLYCHAMPGTIEKVLLTLDLFLTKNPKCNNLLNLGGGTGQVSSMIRDLGFNVYNLDIDIDVNDVYNKMHDLNAEGDLPYDLSTFDFVLCQEVVEHIENPWKLFRDINRVLKKDGVLILTTPNIQSSYSKNIFLKSDHGNFNWFTSKDLSYHINPLPFWEVELIASKTGFLLDDVYGNGSYYFSKPLSLKKTLRKNENLIFIYQKK